MVVVAAWISHPAEWHPFVLVALLLAIALGGEWFTVETSSGILSASLGAMVLAMGLLGPAPAGVVGIAAIGLHSAMARRTPAQWLNNLVDVRRRRLRRRAGDTRRGRRRRRRAQPERGAGRHVRADRARRRGGSARRQLRPVRRGSAGQRRPLARAPAARAVPPPAPGRARRGGDRDDPRARLQERRPAHPDRRDPGPVDLPPAGRRARALRATAPSSSRRARVSCPPSSGACPRCSWRASACATRPPCATPPPSRATRRRWRSSSAASEDEQEVIHLAGLLHDIGKFTWSDRVLHPEQLTDEDWAVIRRHPQDGATMVGKLDGFGPVADAILYHHERVDGGGYPAGLIGNEIPLASRIVAICQHLRHDDQARNLRPADEPRGGDGRAAQRRRGASSTRTSSRSSSRCSSARARRSAGAPTTRPSSRSRPGSERWPSRAPARGDGAFMTPAEAAALHAAAEASDSTERPARPRVRKK